MLHRVLNRASRTGFTPYYYDLAILAEKAQYDLFRHSCHKGHCLNHLYTVKLRPAGAMRLRTRGHDYEFPAVKFDFNKQNFVVRFLFHYERFSLVLLSLWSFFVKCYSVNMRDFHV